eukprot:11211470-Lingulodinium_polyedra.AAC.1
MDDDEVKDVAKELKLPCTGCRSSGTTMSSGSAFSATIRAWAGGAGTMACSASAAGGGGNAKRAVGAECLACRKARAAAAVANAPLW